MSKHKNFIIDNKELSKILKKLDIKYIDDTWNKTDWVVVVLSGILGSIVDILITQTKILKPLDKKIREKLDGSNFKKLLESLSIKTYDNKSVPIDFQDFEMPGLRSLHEIFSSAHDPIRFIEGIAQMMSGEFKGFDRFGVKIEKSIIDSPPSIIQSVVSYFLHMLADFCNANSLPYPGSTIIAQFGSQEVRDKIAAAYRKKVFNSRIFIYHGFPALILEICINIWAICDYYNLSKKIDLFAGKRNKYCEMLLVANSIVMFQNLGINSLRLKSGQMDALFRVNWLQIVNTIKYTVTVLRNENKKQNKIIKDIDELYENIQLDESTINKFKTNDKKEDITDDINKLIADIEEEKKYNKKLKDLL